MADRKKRLDSNVEGNFYVDSTCIDCDTCRQLAPASFEEAGDYSAVTRQPRNELETLQAYQALLACPVGSIGTERSDRGCLRTAKGSFPLWLADGVYYCGFNSEKSFGANSFFIQHQDGNWLIDSPRYITHLTDAFAQMGGVRYIFLTHEDDVADAAKYANHFGAERIIHRADADAMPGAERIIDGWDPVHLARQFVVIPVPGHTPGSCALLYDERVLCTGDHLWWEPETRRLNSPRRLVSDHEQLLRSIERLRAHRFEWVLAGHGDRVRLDSETMRNKLEELLERRKPQLSHPGIATR
ncbi:MBL fold metallo-hydrolase [Nitrospira sp.]|nr:MBL fold metallo-hydrolase [Nitrospira sp.]